MSEAEHELERWTIRSGHYRAEVLQAGGGLSGLWHDDAALVAPTAAPVTGAHGQVLVPWPNRIRDGRYEFGGTEQQLAISEPEFHNACHGLVRWTAWTLLDRAPDALRVGAAVVPQSGYPWHLDVEVGYAVAGDGLTVTFAATNRSASAAPFAAGLHPYLDAGRRADDVVLTLPADTHQLTDDRHLPAGVEPSHGDHDFRTGRPIGALQLDDAWTDLHRDDAGWAVVQLAAEHTIELHLGPQWRWVQVFTGDTLPRGARETIAVEPMSAPADAFNSGTDLVTLQPAQTWEAMFRICHVSAQPPGSRGTE